MLLFSDSRPSQYKKREIHGCRTSPLSRAGAPAGSPELFALAVSVVPAPPRPTESGKVTVPWLHSDSSSLGLFFLVLRASLIAQLVKNPPAMQVRFLGREDPLEKG